MGIVGQVILTGRASVSHRLMGGIKGTVVWAGLSPHNGSWLKACSTLVSIGGTLSFKGPKVDMPSPEQIPVCSLTSVLGRDEVAFYQGHRRARMWVFALTPLPLRTGSRYPPCCFIHVFTSVPFDSIAPFQT